MITSLSQHYRSSCSLARITSAVQEALRGENAARCCKFTKKVLESPKLGAWIIAKREETRRLATKKRSLTTQKPEFN